MRPNETLVYGQLFPASNTLEGLYIDDHLTFQVLDKKPSRPRGRYRDEEIIDKARARYAELKLPRSEKKAFDKSIHIQGLGNGGRFSVRACVSTTRKAAADRVSHA